MDFFLGSMVRDHEGYGFRYTELTGVTVTIRGKQRKTRTVEISPRLAGNKQSAQTQQLRISLSQLQRKTEPTSTSGLAGPREESGCEIPHGTHKLRKTGASRRYLKGVGLPTLMLELGHESLATTQDYLADVRREDEAKKAVADADFVPKPRLVSGTDGD